MENDTLACIVATALADDLLKPLLRAEIERKVLLAAARSPKALRLYSERFADCAHADVIVGDLAAEALPGWRDHRLIGEFLNWFEASSRRKKVQDWACRYRRELEGRFPSAVTYTEPQKRVLERLHLLADLYESSQARSWAIRPRTNPLLVAPSGSGKSFLVEAFARERGAAFMRLTYGNWVVRGAKSGMPTLVALADVISRNRFTVLCVDELDKVGRGLSSDWSVAMRDELFSVLDRRALDGLRLKEDPERSREEPGRILRERVMIVGCATFHELWGAAGRAVGFGREDDADVAAQIEAAGVIAEELRRRFDARLLVLPPLSETQLRDTAAADGLEELAGALGVEVDYQAGAESGLGMRWLEALRTDLELVRMGADARELGYVVRSGPEGVNRLSVD
ncbi:MAG: ATP-binding protein [Opitutaceae bacterium]|nr:ATP-binding protein [Opitutaceae bacterium]